MTGCINTSLPDKDSVFDNCRLSAKEHNLQHEVLGPEEVAARFPGYRLPPGFKVRAAPKACLYMCEDIYIRASYALWRQIVHMRARRLMPGLQS